MTPAKAQALHDATTARGAWMVWHVSTSDAEKPGKATAWAVTADASGGTRSPGLLVADTLDKLRTMLPSGLARHDRTAFMPADVHEVWD